MPINTGIDKEDLVHIYKELLLSNQKEQNNAFAATWIDLATVIQSEISERKTLYINIYVESRKMV